MAKDPRYIITLSYFGDVLWYFGPFSSNRIARQYADRMAEWVGELNPLAFTIDIEDIHDGRITLTDLQKLLEGWYKI